MRVLFLQRQPCIRALKYGVGLRAALPGARLGFACQGLTLSAYYGRGDELFDRWYHLEEPPAADLRRAIEDFRPDVLHSHNLPDSLTVLALEWARGRVPVIHDVHDLQSLRATTYEDGFPEPKDPLELERRAVEGADALVTVSDELVAATAARHALPALREVFPNYALRRDLPARLPPAGRPAADPPRLVYQGSLSTNGSHYDLREIFTGLATQGAAVHVHPARPAPAAYRALGDAHPGIVVHAPLEPVALLRALPRYDYGWAGFNATLNGPHLDTALPNKAFEYVACGLPVLTIGHRALSAFVRRERVGVDLVTLEDAAARLRTADLPALRRRVAARRERFTVEANIGRVLRLYRALGASVPRTPRRRRTRSSASSIVG
jgi:glycosyltransferase involved in cell wall biosynthesis